MQKKLLCNWVDERGLKRPSWGLRKVEGRNMLQAAETHDIIFMTTLYFASNWSWDFLKSRAVRPKRPFCIILDLIWMIQRLSVCKEVSNFFHYSRCDLGFFGGEPMGRLS